MPRKGDLEARLAELTREFVVRLVREIRNASFAEVAALPEERPAGGSPPRPRADRAEAGPRSVPRKRRSAAGRAELAEQVIAQLGKAGKPLGVRDISSALGVTPEAIAAPLRELRAAGRIRKHGDKRATRYSEP